MQYSKTTISEPEHKPFCLPTTQLDMCMEYRYLTEERGRDGKVILAFARAGRLFEDAKHHHVVFMETDETGNVRQAHKRGAVGDSVRTSKTVGRCIASTGVWLG